MSNLDPCPTGPLQANPFGDRHQDIVEHGLAGRICQNENMKMDSSSGIAGRFVGVRRRPSFGNLGLVENLECDSLGAKGSVVVEKAPSHALRFIVSKNALPRSQQVLSAFKLPRAQVTTVYGNPKFLSANRSLAAQATE